MVRAHGRAKGSWLRRAILSAAGAGLLAGAAECLAANRGVEAGDKGKFAAAVGLAGDSDCFVMELPKGSRLTVTVKASKKSALLPTLGLLRPDGASVDVSGVLAAKGSKAQIRNADIPESGLWALLVSGREGSTGEYEVLFKVKNPVKAGEKDLALAQEGVLVCGFPGDTGATVALTVRWKDGPAPAGVEVLAPDGSVAVPGTSFKVSPTKFALGKTVLSAGFGDYAVRILGPTSGGGTTVDCQVKLKFAKASKSFTDLLAEPAVTSVSPTGGFPGRVVTVTGQEFQAGARVFFGEDEATGVVVVSSTSLTCTVPGGIAADTGDVVDGTVQNSDGQTGVSVGAFDYRLMGTFIYAADAPLPVLEGFPDRGFSSFALGDLDGDGLPDLVTASDPDYGYDEYVRPYYTSWQPTRVLHGGPGFAFSFEPSRMPGPLTASLEDWGAERVQVGDLDGDGDLDMVLSRQEGRRIGYDFDPDQGPDQ